MRAVRAAAIGLGLVLVLLVAQSEAQSATKFGSDSLLPPGYAAKQLEKPSNKNIWVSAALVRLLSVSDISFSFDSIVVSSNARVRACATQSHPSLLTSPLHFRACRSRGMTRGRTMRCARPLSNTGPMWPTQAPTRTVRFLAGECTPPPTLPSASHPPRDLPPPPTCTPTRPRTHSHAHRHARAHAHTHSLLLFLLPSPPPP